jgi:hypothetical protein
MSQNTRIETGRLGLHKRLSVTAGILIGAALLSGSMPCTAQEKGKTPSPLTQQRINEFAAALDRAVRTLVDDAGLRHPQEPLPAYFKRIVVLLPTETPTQYGVRLEGYLRNLEQSAQATGSLRKTPPLQDTTPANQARWQRIVHTLSLLPARIKKLRAVYRRERSHKLPANAPRTLAQEFHQTLILVLSARDNLRDARP